MRGKFVVKESKKGFQFTLLATNGREIAKSVVYPSKRNCVQGIESLRKHAPNATVVETPIPARVGAAKPAASKATSGNGARSKAAARTAVKAASPARAKRPARAATPRAKTATGRATRTKKSA